MGAQSKMIRLENVTKNYGKKTLLRGVSLTIQKGEIFGLLGANGAGKSTLLSILATVLKPSEGTVTVNGLDLLRDAKKVRRLIGYVPQDIALWEEFTVKENLVLWSRFGREKVTEQQLLQLCEAVQLKDKWNEKVASLSGGMKRKLNIAVALMHDPAILLMDEPTVGIDLQSKLEINQYVKALSAQGKTIVYITHDLTEIVQLCSRIGVLRKGCLEFTGTIEQAEEKLRKQGVAPEGVHEVVYEMLKE